MPKVMDVSRFFNVVFMQVLVENLILIDFKYCYWNTLLLLDWFLVVWCYIPTSC